MKILFVLQFSWGDSLGVSKVHYDLKLEYERLGHQVDVLCLDHVKKLIRENPTGKLYPRVPSLLHQHLKKVAKKYDVIDANYQCVPYSKRSFDFNGLLVFRSHGLPPLYRESERNKKYQNMLKRKHQKPVRLKTRLGGILRMAERFMNKRDLDRSIKCADLVHCLNTSEHAYLREIEIPERKIVHLPNGIPDSFFESAARTNCNVQLGSILYLASWTVRKGIYDLDSILEGIAQKASLSCLNVVGSHADQGEVLDSLSPRWHSLTRVVPDFNNKELPDLVRTCHVGVFPSYIEGFGLAVLEQLACGIPVIAYDVPGPRDILLGVDKKLLAPVGDAESLAERVAEIMNMPSCDYAELSAQCRARAEEYRVSVVANKFLDIYGSHVSP